ncbi:putative O-glycosylation ligase, exosortase A system-associated [Pseudoduganella sp. UC29_106]|uniref:putative O-glycosylation ligase, exosortase A system-associated n=1 Tax=Pseudoduganella sp. UC29_106 TaxID=3374553 RepID=UPI0037573B83
MRDILVTLIVFGSLPYIFKRPYYGAIMWIWISVMNPHTQGWGFAREFPFAAIIAVTTLLAMLSKPKEIRFPDSPAVKIFLLFVLWMVITTAFSFYPEDNLTALKKVIKIMGMTLVIWMLVRSREEIEGVIWAVAISLGYYGVKGGIFTIQTGGQFRVWGPYGTFIDGNNEIALALIMTVPLMLYLLRPIQNKWYRRAMVASAGLCALASLGSYSRGAAVALAGMLFVLWLKSPRKVLLGTIMVMLIPLALMFMPQQWHNRIDTIDNYEQDGSAMGRINAWKMAFNLANDRPLVGGGFNIYDPFIFNRYAPNPEDIHAAHSIYFQVLGEHGYIGLLLYLLLYLAVWREGAWVLRHARGMPSLEWATALVRMIQVSLVGFMIGGAFLSLAYFDVPYYLMVAMVAARKLVEEEIKVGHAPLAEEEELAQAEPALVVAGGGGR